MLFCQSHGVSVGSYSRLKLAATTDFIRNRSIVVRNKHVTRITEEPFILKLSVLKSAVSKTLGRTILRNLEILVQP